MRLIRLRFIRCLLVMNMSDNGLTLWIAAFVQAPPPQAQTDGQHHQQQEQETRRRPNGAGREAASRRI